jgi:hypothetical protein
VLLLVPLLFAGPLAPDSAAALVAINVPNFALLATLFALNGLSGVDRQRGYFRFLFAKPVRVPWYYAQAFAVRAVGVLVVTLALLAAYALATRSPLAWWALAYVALTYLLVGGVGFLVGSITHHDGIVLVVVFVLTAVARLAVPAATAFGPRAGGALQFVAALLPPFHLLDPARDALAAGAAPAPGHLTWALAYGLGCLAAGLLVLRHRPLSS